MANDHPSSSELEPREPTVEDLRDLCRELNARGAKYIVIGGFAIRAAGVDYARASSEIVIHVVDGVPIPFASPALLWRMKAVTHREKDAADLVFLRHWFPQRGEQPPAT